MRSKILRRSLCVLGLEAARHITLTSGMRDLLVKGEGGERQRRLLQEVIPIRVEDQRRCFNVFCVIQRMQDRKPRYLLHGSCSPLARSAHGHC